MAAVAVAVVLILAFIGIVGYFLVNYMFKEMFAPATEYEVPSLLGYTLEELRSDPALLDGFTFVEGSTVFSEEYERSRSVSRSQPPVRR